MSYKTMFLILIGMMMLFYLVVTAPKGVNTQEAAELKCIENNGTPLHESWGGMIDCKPNN